VGVIVRFDREGVSRLIFLFWCKVVTSWGRKLEVGITFLQRGCVTLCVGVRGSEIIVGCVLSAVAVVLFERGLVRWVFA
jgi:hypothetical protein